jgi:hypothetical protein
MHLRPTASRRARFLIAPLLTLALVTTGAIIFAPVPAQAESEEDLQAQKDHWQSEYRRLLRNAAQLKENSRRSREDYAQAQRRNYPRGGARQRLMVQAEQAEADLVTVQEEIEEFRLRAQREGALPRWLYEVEDEEIVLPEPAAPDASMSDGEAEEDDRAGRNPLYFDEEEDDS